MFLMYNYLRCKKTVYLHHMVLVQHILYNIIHIPRFILVIDVLFFNIKDTSCKSFGDEQFRSIIVLELPRHKVTSPYIANCSISVIVFLCSSHFPSSNSISYCKLTMTFQI